MRQLGWGWHWAWVLGFTFLCVYIAFDVLDLDGSQLAQRSGVAITTATSTGEADRVRATAPPPPIWPYLPVLAGVSGLSLQFAITRFGPLRTYRFLPRQHLSHSHLGSRAPASAEPA